MTKKQSRKLASQIRSVKKSLRTSESRYFSRCQDTWTQYYKDQDDIMELGKLLNAIDKAYRATKGIGRL